MERFIYIKKQHSTHFVEFAEALNPELYDNIGTTWQDYEDNLWVRLSDEQVAFYEEHPKAKVKEVWDMELTPAPVRTLEQAKEEKKWAIEGYDSSSEVNGFVIVIGEQEIEAWIDRETRADYKNSLDAAELLGRTEVTPVFNGMALTIPVTMAKMALAQIQLYANQCYNVTEQHKVAVDALETIEAVDAYDYETGYPEKLRFEVPLANAEEVVADEQE